jgi:hypothetical protein
VTNARRQLAQRSLAQRVPTGCTALATGGRQRFDLIAFRPPEARQKFIAPWPRMKAKHPFDQRSRFGG